MHPFCNLQSRTRTDAVLEIGLYDLLDNPTTLTRWATQALTLNEDKQKKRTEKTKKMNITDPPPPHPTKQYGWIKVFTTDKALSGSYKRPTMLLLESSDTTMTIEKQTKQIRYKPSYKQLVIKTHRTSFCMQKS